jgi:hypothetical protein
MACPAANVPLKPSRWNCIPQPTLGIGSLQKSFTPECAFLRGPTAENDHQASSARSDKTVPV